MPDENTITYTLEPADMRAFFTHNRRHHAKVKRTRYFALLLAAVFSLCNALAEPAHRDRWVGYFIINFTIIGGCTLFFGNLFLRMRQLYRLKAPPPGLFCEHTITLADEALIEVTPVNEGRHPWSELHSVIDGKRHIFIFVHSNAAHTIPKRAFPDPGAARAFFLRASQLFTNAKSSV